MRPGHPERLRTAAPVRRGEVEGELDLLLRQEWELTMLEAEAQQAFDSHARLMAAYRARFGRP